jgi:hypothetical protein
VRAWWKDKWETALAVGMFAGFRGGMTVARVARRLLMGHFSIAHTRRGRTMLIVGLLDLGADEADPGPGAELARPYPE